MNKTPDFWRAIEATYGMKAASVTWDQYLGTERARLSGRTRPTGRQVNMYPCPDKFGCGFDHEIRIWRETDIAAVPVDDEYDRCRVYKLKHEDIVEYEMDADAILRESLHLLDIMPGELRPTDFLYTYAVGSFSRDAGCAIQVYLTIPEERRQFRQAATGLLAMAETPFVFMSLTPKFMDTVALEGLARRKCPFLMMEDLVAAGDCGEPTILRGLSTVLRPQDTPVEESSPNNVFRREGDLWLLAFEGKTVHVPHSKGLAYIACLLRAQGRELHVAQVLAETAGVADVPSLGSAGEVLAPAALAKYKERILELREQIEEAGRFNDIGRKARLEEELDAVTQQIGSAFGLYGRVRKASDDAERVRKSVGTNIRRCLEKLTSSHPRLGEHLNRSLSAGQYLSYAPSSAVAWLV
jgi:hypothetical protein